MSIWPSAEDFSYRLADCTEKKNSPHFLRQKCILCWSLPLDDGSFLFTAVNSVSRLDWSESVAFSFSHVWSLSDKVRDRVKFLSVVYNWHMYTWHRLNTGTTWPCNPPPKPQQTQRKWTRWHDGHLWVIRQTPHDSINTQNLIWSQTSVAKFLSMAYINGRRSLVFHWEVPGRWLQYSQLSNYSIALSSFVLVIYVYVLFCYSLGLKSVRISPKRRLVIK